jgi:hypothetical protein
MKNYRTRNIKSQAAKQGSLSKVTESQEDNMNAHKIFKLRLVRLISQVSVLKAQRAYIWAAKFYNL